MIGLNYNASHNPICSSLSNQAHWYSSKDNGDSVYVKLDLKTMR